MKRLTEKFLKENKFYFNGLKIELEKDITDIKKYFYYPIYFHDKDVFHACYYIDRDKKEVIDVYCTQNELKYTCCDNFSFDDLNMVFEKILSAKGITFADGICYIVFPKKWFKVFVKKYFIDKKIKLSELRKEADEDDYLGHHLEEEYTDSGTGDLHLAIRIHTLPSGDVEYYDDWWHLFVDINLTKKVIENHYDAPDYDGFKVIVDE